MPDREKVIKWLDVCKTSHYAVGIKEDYPCRLCPYYDKEYCMKQLITDALALLKEQETKTQGGDSGMCEICSFYERAMPVKPVRDEKTGRFWLCGNCGEYVGFEDNDPSDPNEFDNFCRNCGRKVKWE